MTTYENVLKRLTSYRKSAEVTQEEIASKLRISQEVYSYLENGKVIISGQLMIKLDNIGLSIDKLISGKTYDYNTQDLESCINLIFGAEAKDFILKLLSEIIVNNFIKDSAAISDNSLLLNALIRSWDNFSMLRFVRSKLKLNQIDMAERLGLCIKKYRVLERELIYPDAEMLSFLYNISGYEPALFMNMPGRKLQIVKSVWETLSPEKKASLVECAAALRECIMVTKKSRKEKLLEKLF